MPALVTLFLSRIAGACARGGGDCGLHLDLVNEVRAKPGDGMRAAVTKHGLVGRQIGLPAHLPHRARLLATLNITQRRFCRIDVS